ncbi:MAG TPA: ATP-binding protein [Geothrix sp.]|nr:ATP-binding protein [Geothrix sp.]
MRRLLPLLLQWLLALGAAVLWGGAGAPGPVMGPAEAGYPSIRNYSPRTYGADAQNWAVLQDPRGIVYAGNNRGVLAFDGVRWRLIPTPLHTPIRSLGMDETGRIYVGAVGEIGYLGAGAHGESEFVSLKEKLPEGARTFSDVWATGHTSRGTFFQSREFLFLLKDDRVQVAKASTSFHLAFVVGDRIFVRQRDVGLQEWRGGRLALVPGGERFAKESVFTMLSLGGSSGANRGAILVGSRRIGLWRLDPGGLRPFKTPAEPYLMAQGLYGGGRLENGTLALATIKGGVVLLDAEGRIQGILDRRSGLQSDNVKALCPDRDSGVWLALDSGLSRVEWPSPFSAFDERCGLTGTAWAIQRFKGRLYVGTGQGAFVQGPVKPEDPRPRFEPLEGVSTQCLAFLPLEDRLLFACSQGVFEVQDRRVLPVRSSSNSALAFLRSGSNPSHIFVGMQGGLILLQHPPGSKNWRDLGAIPGVEDDVYSMTEDGQGRLWLGTFSSAGALRVTFPPGWKGGGSGPVPLVERFPADRGLSMPAQTRVLLWQGAVLAASRSGVLRFDEARKCFVAEPRFAALFPERPRGINAMEPDDAGRIWLDTRDEISGLHEVGVAVAGADGTLRWEAAPYRRFAETPIEVIQVEPSGVAWFGGPSGVTRYDPALGKGSAGPERVLIRRVSEEGTLIFGGEGSSPQKEGEAPVLPFTEGALRFEFALPAFDVESSSQYQVRLDGYDREWSPWTPEAQKEYTNLPGGAYCFRVRGRDGYGRVGPEQGFVFRVLPPWYRKGWALLLFLGAAGLILAAGVRLRTRLLQARNLALQRRVDVAIEALRDRERLLASQAGELMRANAQLLDLHQQKNQFLAMVVHDLRNPLTSILLATQLIEEEDDVQQIRLRAQGIAREGADMESLIGRFLDISALDSEGIKTEPGRLSLTALVEHLRQRHEPKARAKRIRLETVPTEEEIWSFADPKFISSVLDNLFSNAIKFSPFGTTVTVRIWRAEGRVRVAVQDQGPGLSEADQAGLFRRFSKLSAQPTGGEPSVGLGLSIAKQMVEACGGRIWVESTAGAGATFTVDLPGCEG